MSLQHETRCAADGAETHTDAETPALTGEACLHLVAQVLREKRATLRGTLNATFLVVDEGSYVLEVNDGVRVFEGLHEDVDLMVVCNAQTLADLLAGQFDYQNPRAEHLWVWGGEDEVWARLDATLSAAKSWLSSRITAISVSRRADESTKKGTRR